MPPTFQSCLERAKQFVQDEVSSLRLAGEFLEHEYSLRESDGRVKAAENLVNHYIELEAQWKTTLQKMDRLRAMERCSSSSGVLKSMEGNLKLVDDEQPHRRLDLHSMESKCARSWARRPQVHGQ